MFKNSLRNGTDLNLVITYMNRFKIKSEEEYSKNESKELRFLRNCPHFLANTCASISWDSKSPCWKCLSEQKYNPRNAETQNNDTICLVAIKDKKCR